MKVRIFAVCAVVGASLMLDSRDASAQVPGQVYDDVKGVIENLIEKDVAQTVVPNIACQAPVTLVYFQSTLQRVYDRQFGGLRSSIETDAADLAGSLVYYVLTRPEAEKNDEILLEFVRSEVSANNLGEFAASDKCGEAIKSKGGPVYFGANTRTLIDRACSAGSVSVACDLARATKDVALGDNSGAEGELRLAAAAALSPHGTPAEVGAIAALIQRYIAAISVTPAATLDSQIALDASFPAGVADAGFQERLRRLARDWQLATSSGRTAMTLSAFQRYLLMATDALSLCDAAECKKLRKLVGAGSAEVRRIFESVSAHDIASVAVDVLRGFFSLKKQADCDAHPAILPNVSKDVEKYNLITQTNVSKPEKAQAPAPVVAPVVAEAQAPADCDRQLLINRYGQFLATLASYSLEVARNGSTTAETRSAFASAAFDIMQTEGPRTGMNRPWGWNFLWPKPSLRLSWNTGYVNQPTSDGFRYLATVDWLTFKIPIRYTSSAYIAANVSLVDLLGPFSESTLRKQGSYNNSNLEWSEFLIPRLELTYGMPRLTTHLVVAGGISYRTAAVSTNTSGVLSYYSPYGGKPADFPGSQASFYSQFIETGIGVRYLP